MQSRNNSTIEMIGIIPITMGIAGRSIEWDLLRCAEGECPAPVLIGNDLLREFGKMSIGTTKNRTATLRPGEQVIPDEHRRWAFSLRTHEEVPIRSIGLRFPW